MNDERFRVHTGRPPAGRHYVDVGELFLAISHYYDLEADFLNDKEGCSPNYEGMRLELNARHQRELADFKAASLDLVKAQERLEITGAQADHNELMATIAYLRGMAGHLRERLRGMIQRAQAPLMPFRDDPCTQQSIDSLKVAESGLDAALTGHDGWPKN